MARLSGSKMIQGTDSHQKVHETIHHLTVEITEGTIRGQSDRVSLGLGVPFGDDCGYGYWILSSISWDIIFFGSITMAVSPQTKTPNSKSASEEQIL